jgi:hypothetical protein
VSAANPYGLHQLADYHASHTAMLLRPTGSQIIGSARNP